MIFKIIHVWIILSKTLTQNCDSFRGKGLLLYAFNDQLST